MIDARLRPHREHHLGRGEGADRRAGPVQRRALGAHRIRRGAGAQDRLAAHNVTINNLLPGAFDTDRLRKTMEGAAAKTGRSVEELAAARAKGIPAQRFGTADEFGAACAFLCSAQLGYLTGQNVLIDGGSYPGTF
jgi:3-oxoacyl-[acyl-carrier protein] reductase